MLSLDQPAMLDSRTFRAIMGAFPGGVAVVTAIDDEGRPHGATLNSMTSVSAEPPMLLLCLEGTSRSLKVIRRARRFAINILSSGSAAISNLFASKSANKFANVNWHLTEAGNPLLSDNVVAHAECQLFKEIEAGDHYVIIGTVHAGGAPEPGEQPLLYFRKTYDTWPVPC